ncbi:hypothetical protein A2U01_0114301, partial [Trifolium medium]|nr:hypothetical protein [Trifolium medium]
MMQKTGLGLLPALGVEAPALGAVKIESGVFGGCGLRPVWLVLRQVQ